MKRVIALIISLVFLGSAAMAEIPDVELLSNEDLVKLLYYAQNEIVARGIEKSSFVEQGVYVAGKDIPVGMYLCESAADKGSGLFAVYPKDCWNLPSKAKIYDAASVKRESTYYISLDEGDILTIPYQFKLTITTGIKFE